MSGVTGLPLDKAVTIAGAVKELEHLRRSGKRYCLMFNEMDINNLAGLFSACKVLIKRERDRGNRPCRLMVDMVYQLNNARGINKDHLEQQSEILIEALKDLPDADIKKLCMSEPLPAFVMEPLKRPKNEESKNVGNDAECSET